MEFLIFKNYAGVLNIWADKLILLKSCKQPKLTNSTKWFKSGTTRFPLDQSLYFTHEMQVLTQIILPHGVSVRGVPQVFGKFQDLKVCDVLMRDTLLGGPMSLLFWLLRRRKSEQWIILPDKTWGNLHNLLVSSRGKLWGRRRMWSGIRVLNGSVIRFGSQVFEPIQNDVKLTVRTENLCKKPIELKSNRRSILWTSLLSP